MINPDHMKRIFAIAASIALAFAITSCNQTQKTMEQTITPNPENAARAQQFIKDAGGTYFLASAEVNGQAHVRPFGISDSHSNRIDYHIHDWRER